MPIPRSTPRRRWGVTLLGSGVAILLCIACVGSSVPDPVASPFALATSPDISELISDAGCGQDAPLGVIRGASVHDGAKRVRQFDLMVAPGYDSRKASPLVFLFHGAWGSPDEAWIKAYQGLMTELGENAIVVIPQGIPFKNFGVGWDQSCTGYDMPFYDAMIRAISARYCVAGNRILASGFSWGADMVNALACCRGDTLHAVAPFSGAETDYNAHCATRRYPAARFRYGSDHGAAGDGAYKLHQFEDTARFYAKSNACSSQSGIEVPGSVCRNYPGCESPVQVCADPALGHVGPDRTELSALWQFWRSLR